MCVFSSHSFWTSSSLDVPAGVTQEKGHTRFFIHLLSAVRVSISHYVLHIAMLVLLIDYSSKYKPYASEPFLYSGTATHACFGLTFPAAGCKCIHLTRVHVHCCTAEVHPYYQSACSLLYRYSADIRTCTDTDARVMVQNR